MNNIGLNISILRKEKGITQEELAKHIGISAQAVSKWENGGVPDIELLPKIADYFEIPIDRLFDRDAMQYKEYNTAFIKKIINTPEKERFKVAFEYCWDIERALTGHDFGDGSIKEYANAIEKNQQRYSSMLYDQGFTRMGIANKLQYFLLVPETENKELAFFDNIDYCELFKQLSDKDFFKALVFLNQRDSDKSFTPKLLEKNIDISEEKAKAIISVLKKYKLIFSDFIELDDEVQEYFRFSPTPSFVALLIFAREIICPPTPFTYYFQYRNKPYLL
ncbi:MAG: helix-turn-helix transcriptional regulator [Clostridia bacterium]|nr:helix-turn-helix transcriptional regulator [Clostridia bacterium]